MEHDMDASLKSISVNGGMTKNQFIIRFLVDLLALPLKKQQNPDVSALGAAYLSGLKSGVFENITQLKAFNQTNTDTILPDFNNETVKIGYDGWKNKISKPA
jgi:glycerol kinase